MRRKMIVPFTYATFREDCVDADGEQAALRLDKLAGHKHPATPTESLS